MNKLAKAIAELSQEELKAVKKELELGNIQRMVSLRIKEDGDMNKVCPVCHTDVNEESMTLHFGPKDLRKKASFCASDCLEYFLQRINEQKNPNNVVGGLK